MRNYIHAARILPLICAHVALATTLRASGGGGGSTFIIVQKLEQFDQTANGAPTADAAAPYIFRSSSELATTVTPPSGTGYTLMDEGGGRFDYSQSFSSQSALDAAFADGNFTLSVGGSAGFTLGLTGDLYPSAPQVTGGTWNSSGQLVLDSAQSNTLTFNGFPAYGTSGVVSHMQLTLQSADGSTVNLQQSNITPSNPAAFTSYVIPANTLSPGSIYFGSLEYDTGTAVNSTAVSGYTAAALYSASTNFVLVTSGVPQNAPTITAQPTDLSGPIGSSVAFSVGFTGTNTYVQWFKNGVPINSAQGSGSTLALSNIQNSDVASYFAIVANAAGSYAQTDTVTFSIGSGDSNPPAVSVQPMSQTIAMGASVAFKVSATGNPTYQWMYSGGTLSDSGNVSGVTSPTLLIREVNYVNQGNYYCILTNSNGVAQSNAGVLTVFSTPNPGRLINISCRAQVGTAGDILIAGFAVGGAGTSGSEPVLIRGSGPALTQFNLPGTLPDPELLLFNGTTNAQIAANAGWNGSSEIAGVAAQVGAFSWNTPTSHDSALVQNLVPGPYSAQVAGQSGDTGVGLAEIYDATPAASYTPSSPRLINISCRVKVGTGTGILIAGFAIGGTTSETVLIRASGPALTQFSVPGTLPDPKLQLLDSGGTVLASNSGWGGGAEISSVAAQVGAFAWGNPSSSDSAILITLKPGTYTAQVSGANGDTGVALVEAYEVQ